MKRSDPPHECVSIHVASMKNIDSGAFWGQTVAVNVAKYCSKLLFTACRKTRFLGIRTGVWKLPTPVWKFHRGVWAIHRPVWIPDSALFKARFCPILGSSDFSFQAIFRGVSARVWRGFWRGLGAFDGLRHRVPPTRNPLEKTTRLHNTINTAHKGVSTISMSLFIIFSLDLYSSMRS